MTKRTVPLNTPAQKQFAHRLLDAAPMGHVLEIREPRRSSEQNDKMWAMLTDIARAKPLGRKLEPEQWKSVFMDAIGKKPNWIPNLEGDGVLCTGYRSSHLSKQDMSDLIEQIYAFGAANGVVWNAHKDGGI